MMQGPGLLALSRVLTALPVLMRLPQISASLKPQILAF